MPSYSHNYITVTKELVQCILEFSGGTDKNYVKTNQDIQTLTKVTQSGVDITSSCSIEDLGGAIGSSITFGSPSTRLGLVIIDYTSTSGVVITQEAKQIIRHNIGGSQQNYIEVRNYPVKDSSVTILDGDGNDRSASLASISGQGREKLEVGTLSPGLYQISYEYDNGQPGFLYRDNYSLNSEISTLSDFINETTTEYTSNLVKYTNSREVAKKNYRLWLIRKILTLSPVQNESSLLTTLKNNWSTIKTTPPNTTQYNSIRTDVENLKVQMENNGSPENQIVVHTKNNPIVHTYLARLAELDIQELDFNFEAVTRYDYDGSSNSSNLVVADREKLTNNLTTISNSYSELDNYSLRLVLSNSTYIIGVEIVITPSDNSEDLLDELYIHIATSDSLTPSLFNNGSNTDKQISNQSFKDLFKGEYNKYNSLTFINEPLKDGNGAPVSKDENNNSFDHRVILKRKALYIFKKSYRDNNYIANIKLYTPSDDVITYLESLSSSPSESSRIRVYQKLTSFISSWEDTEDRIGAWRGDTNKGVSSSGNIGDLTEEDAFGNRIYADTNSNTSISGYSSAWSNVRSSIDSIFDSDFEFSSAVDTVRTSWESLLTSESISTDEKIIDSNLSVWKKKYEEENQNYISARNSKNTKDVQRIEKNQIISAYGTLPTIN